MLQALNCLVKRATSAYFAINATANDESLGLVQGSGTRQLGTFAQVEAMPYPDSKFLGPGLWTIK
ncbi:hypothetical protein AMS62_06375 [Bacillus sp. FJAT-18019]|uniref:Uncharacterized protein n=1 Tax=Paenibacillus solani TaxID=1705565 RepID=A0A0M1NZY0_9BACL|nr:hypothetical protein AMS62_06375 [Bacillus sp. FJAT-18019]KOR87776.1 hypothetical protein AM231_00535 [Paenibacillus solani]